MKKRAWLILVLWLPLAIAAQPPDKKNKRDTVNRKESISSKSKIVPFSALDQRKIYKWENGQKATPAARQAADTSVRYARVFGDSAVVIRDARKKQKKVE